MGHGHNFLSWIVWIHPDDPVVHFRLVLPTIPRYAINPSLIICCVFVGSPCPYVLLARLGGHHELMSFFDPTPTHRA